MGSDPSRKAGWKRHDESRFAVGVTTPFSFLLFLMRKRHEWKLPRFTLALGARTVVMGILNVTPDSFSDGGQYSGRENAIAGVEKWNRKARISSTLEVSPAGPEVKRWARMKKGDECCPSLKYLRKRSSSRSL